jgi:hypothetical protein
MKMAGTVSLIVVALVSLGSACTGGEPEDADGEREAEAPSAEEAAALLGDAYCERAFQCGPVRSGVQFGDFASCRLSQTSSILSRFTLDGSTVTPQDRVACATTIRATACGPLLEADARWLQLCPASSGTLAEGAGCADDGQCATGFCSFGDRRSIDQPSTCGHCRAKAGLGDPCFSAADCPVPFGCGSATNTCRLDTFLAVGEQGCSEPNSGVCALDDVCDASNGTCAAGPSVGEACVGFSCGGGGVLACVDGLCALDEFCAGGACAFTVPDPTLCSLF